MRFFAFAPSGLDGVLLYPQGVALCYCFKAFSLRRTGQSVRITLYLCAAVPLWFPPPSCPFVPLRAFVVQKTLDNRASVYFKALSLGPTASIAKNFVSLCALRDFVVQDLWPPCLCGSNPFFVSLRVLCDSVVQDLRALRDFVVQDLCATVPLWFTPSFVSLRALRDFVVQNLCATVPLWFKPLLRVPLCPS